MTMAGENISYHRSMTTEGLILKALGYKSSGGLSGQGKLCVKNGVPASNTAADAPIAKGDICYDAENGEVYICTAFTDNENFTWTKVS
jgi:hypothetical protein